MIQSGLLCLACPSACGGGGIQSELSPRSAAFCGQFAAAPLARMFCCCAWIEDRYVGQRATPIGIRKHIVTDSRWYASAECIRRARE